MGHPSSNGQKWFYAYLPNGMAGGATSPLIPLFTRILGGSVPVVGAGAAAASIPSLPAVLGWGNPSGPPHRRKACVPLGLFGTAPTPLLLGLGRDAPRFLLA